MLKGWWQGFNFSGSYSFILTEKLKALKNNSKIKFFALVVLYNKEHIMHHLIRKKLKIKFLKNSKVPLLEVLQTPTP